jgi:hypothetical protein
MGAPLAVGAPSHAAALERVRGAEMRCGDLEFSRDR